MNHDKSHSMHTLTQRLILTGLLSLWSLSVTAADFEREVPADPRGTVEISNVSGGIEVSGWDRPEVRVAARLGENVERVDVSSSGGRTEIKVVLPSISFHDGGSADLHVTIPRESRLEVSSVSAHVTVGGLEGSQRLRSVSGPVNAQIGGDYMEVKTVSGPVQLSGRGRRVQLHVSTISGNLQIIGAAGEIEAGTVSGAVQLQAEAVREVRMRTTSGSVSFEGTLQRGASLDAHSMSGMIRVRALSEDGFEYEVSSFSGGINNCFNVEPERTSRYGPGRRLAGTLGAGKAEVSLKTMSGSVSLCDH